MRETTSSRSTRERSLGHEEVYVVLAGRATFTLDDETLDAPAGTIVFIRDVDVRRHARAEEPGTSVLADRRAARRGVRAVGLGGLLRRRAASHGRATTTRISASWRLLSNAGPTTRRRCTTSRAPRRWPDELDDAVAASCGERSS